MDVHDKWGEKMSDLIRRSDAIEAIEGVDWYHQNSRNKDMVNGANSDEHQAWYKADDVYKALKEVPSSDRPQGEWIDAEIPLESGDTMPIQVCNLCKTFYPLAHTGGGYHFCPNCGAQMKGADDGNK